MSQVRAELERVSGEFRAALRGFVRKRVPNDAIADDLIHEVWVRIAQKLGGLRDLLTALSQGSGR